MIAGVFSIIQIILKLFGLWDSFLSYSDAQRAADAEKKTQDRNAAVDESKKAETEDEIWKAQDEITKNLP